MKVLLPSLRLVAERVNERSDVRVSKYTSGISVNALAASTHPDYASLVDPPFRKREGG
jgi:hypothetical protein